MKLITISGVDGSGKSTQIKLLKNHLESQGKRVFYFHAIKFSIANKFTTSPLYTSKRSSLNVQSDSDTKSIVKANWFTILLRKIALRIDLIRFKVLLNKLARRNRRLSNKNYDYILSDRYFYDTVVNIEYLEKNRNTKKLGSYKLKAGVIKPDLAIYLDADPKNIIQRDRVPDQGLEYLKKKKELFDSSIEKYNFKVINGDRSKEEIFEEIKKLCQINIS